MSLNPASASWNPSTWGSATTQASDTSANDTLRSRSGWPSMSTQAFGASANNTLRSLFGWSSVSTQASRVSEMISTRFSISTEPFVDQRYFYVFGPRLSAGISHVLLKTAFDHYFHKNYKYQTYSEDFQFLSPYFGGASVGLPDDSDLRDCCEVTESAQEIGRVDTLYVISEQGVRNGRIVGTNTHWQAIFSLMILKAGKGVLHEKTAGLVLGSGETAKSALYALYKLGIRTIYLLSSNITSSVALKLRFKKLFPIFVLSSLDTFELETLPQIIIATRDHDDKPALVHNLMFAKEKGLYMEMIYDASRARPAVFDIDYSRRYGTWNFVNGIEVALEQACLQFRLWTKRAAPRDAMSKSLRSNWPPRTDWAPVDA